MTFQDSTSQRAAPAAELTRQVAIVQLNPRGLVAKNNAKPYQIFVSHATADKWLAVILCEKLEKAGASTFRDDRDIDGGDDIPERIRAEIKRSRELGVLLTPNSVNRPWVLLEVGAAWGWSKAIRITPILCHVDVDPIPGMLKSKKAIHINDVANLFAEVKRRVKKHNG